MLLDRAAGQNGRLRTTAKRVVEWLSVGFVA